MAVLKKLRKLPVKTQRGYLRVAQEFFFLKGSRRRLRALGFRLRKGKKKRDVIVAILKGRRQSIKFRAAAVEVELIADKLVKVVRPRKSYLKAA